MRRNLEKNEATCLRTEQLKDKDRALHFHRYLEIYCTVKGKAFFTISGDHRLLASGQMAVVAPFEQHSCEPVGEAEILVVRVGADYMEQFSASYPNKRLPRWLTDDKINNAIYKYMEQSLARESESELQKNGIVCQLLAMVIEGYGLQEQKGVSERDRALVAEIVQYIYDHCNEKITLEFLSKRFYLSPTFLSKKLRKQICVDFRAFVNDIRIHRAIQMMEAPENRDRKIEDIAISCGFSSMSTFYRCYKRNYSFRRLKPEDENQQM